MAKVGDMKKLRSQTIVEFIMLGAAVIAALVFMRMYLYKGVSGRVKQMADTGLGQVFDPAGTFEQNNFQNGTLSYEVGMNFGHSMNMDGEAGERLYYQSQQFMGKDGDAPMKAISYTKSTVSLKKD